MSFNILRDNRGFSLPELIVAATVMMIVVGAAMSLYVGGHRTARVETDFGDVQDNLRLALDQLSKDVRMAGFLTVEPPIVEVSQTEFTISTTTPSRRYARITAPDSSMNTTKTFTIYSDSMVTRFSAGDKVRILRPPNQGQPGEEDVSDPADLVFTVDSIDISGPGAPGITISGFSAAVDYAYAAGDMVVRVIPGAPVVNEIRYRYSADTQTLQRIINGGAPQHFARGLTDMLFEYVRNDEGMIKAVNITLTGAAGPDPGANPEAAGKIGHREKIFRTSVAVRNI